MFWELLNKYGVVMTRAGMTDYYSNDPLVDKYGNKKLRSWHLMWNTAYLSRKQDIVKAPDTARP